MAEQGGVESTAETKIDWRVRARDGWTLLACLGLSTGVLVLAALIRATDGGYSSAGAIVLGTVAFIMGGLGYPILGAWGALLVGSSAAQMKVAQIWLLLALAAGAAGLAMCMTALGFTVLTGGVYHFGVEMVGLSLLAGLPPGAAGLAAAKLGAFLRGRSSDTLSSYGAGIATAMASMAVAGAIAFGVANTFLSEALERELEGRSAAIDAIGEDTAVAYYRYLSQHPSGPGAAHAEQRLYDLDPSFRETERGWAVSSARQVQP